MAAHVVDGVRRSRYWYGRRLGPLDTNRFD
jgi:hypothetical protein